MVVNLTPAFALIAKLDITGTSVNLNVVQIAKINNVAKLPVCALPDVWLVTMEITVRRVVLLGVSTVVMKEENVREDVNQENRETNVKVID